jgi:hypothetical protein
MPNAGRDYISLDASGDNKADFDRMEAIGDAIKAALGERVSYRVLRLGTLERIDEEQRDPDRILEVSGGRLPVLLVNISYTRGELTQADLAPLEAQFGLLIVADTDEMPP